MVTRYDSTKTETAWLADGYLKEVKKLEKCIKDAADKKKFANISDLVSADIIDSTGFEKKLNMCFAKQKKFI